MKNSLLSATCHERVVVLDSTSHYCVIAALITLLLRRTTYDQNLVLEIVSVFWPLTVMNFHLSEFNNMLRGFTGNFAYSTFCNLARSSSFWCAPRVWNI